MTSASDDCTVHAFAPTTRRPLATPCATTKCPVRVVASSRAITRRVRRHGAVDAVVEDLGAMTASRSRRPASHPARAFLDLATTRRVRIIDDAYLR